LPGNRHTHLAAARATPDPEAPDREMRRYVRYRMEERLAPRAFFQPSLSEALSAIHSAGNNRTVP